QHRDPRAAVGVGGPQQLERAQRGGGEAALEYDAEALVLSRALLVEAALHDVAPGRGQAPLELLRLLRVGGRRVAQARVVAGAARESRAHADGGPDVVAADQASPHVRGADPQT